MHDLDLTETLISAIVSRQARVGIIGLGYVGLPLTMAFASKGFSVLAFDIDKRKVEMLETGRSYIRQISDGQIRDMRESGRFAVTADFGRLSEVDVILICVPTPLTAQREPDMSFVEDTTKLIASHLRRGQLIVLEFNHLSRHLSHAGASAPRSVRTAQRPRFPAGLFA